MKNKIVDTLIYEDEMLPIARTALVIGAASGIGVTPSHMERIVLRIYPPTRFHLQVGNERAHRRREPLDSQPHKRKEEECLS